MPRHFPCRTLRSEIVTEFVVPVGESSADQDDEHALRVRRGRGVGPGGTARARERDADCAVLPAPAGRLSVPTNLGDVLHQTGVRVLVGHVVAVERRRICFALAVPVGTTAAMSNNVPVSLTIQRRIDPSESRLSHGRYLRSGQTPGAETVSSGSRPDGRGASVTRSAPASRPRARTSRSRRLWWTPRCRRA